ncbi:hypothetical protein EJB05_06335, partial [Eragrostis curvula]
MTSTTPAPSSPLQPFVSHQCPLHRVLVVMSGTILTNAFSDQSERTRPPNSDPISRRQAFSSNGGNLIDPAQRRRLAARGGTAPLAVPTQMRVHACCCASFTPGPGSSFYVWWELLLEDRFEARRNEDSSFKSPALELQKIERLQLFKQLRHFNERRAKRAG